jgi:hypothetical protein
MLMANFQHLLLYRSIYSGFNTKNINKFET